MALDAATGLAATNPYLALGMSALNAATAPGPSQTASGQSGHITFGSQNFGTQSDPVKYAGIAAIALVALVFLRRKK